MTARGQAMVASRRLDSQLKRERVAAAVDARAATGQELSIAAIARHADVSRKFIYTHPELRAQIEQRARQATAPPTQGPPPTGTSPSPRCAPISPTPRHTTIACASSFARSSNASPKRSAATSPTSSSPAPIAPKSCAANYTTPRCRSSSFKNSSPTHARSSTPSARSTASCSPTETGRRSDNARSRPRAFRRLKTGVLGGRQQHVLDAAGDLAFGSRTSAQHRRPNSHARPSSDHARDPGDAAVGDAFARAAAQLLPSLR
jgi:hypothetical protein